MSNRNLSYLKDSDFLKRLDLENLKKYYVKIIVLTMDELPIRAIEGRVSAGSINIDGSSSVRRTCNLTFLAEHGEKNDLTNIDNLLSINKKIKIEIGLENLIDDRYDEIIWFKQGIFVINQPSISHNSQGVTISLSCKDKMCLLNGECGGGLPASVIFDSYNQINEDGSVTEVENRIYDIIQTLVINYGGENINKVFINDVPLETKQIVRWIGSEDLFYNTATDVYTLNSDAVTNEGTWKTFKYNEDIGYAFVDFVYPGDLISNIGENVCSVLDKIKNILGNYEYFYDIDGNFIFQEVKNYLNNSYEGAKMYRKDGVEVDDRINFLSILDNDNYYVDFNGESKSVYVFNEGNGLITSYSNSPSYVNIKNDFHIWGKNNDGFAIHYHLAVKEKPGIFGARAVVYLKDNNGEYTGRIRLATDKDTNKKDMDLNYIPQDWRAELYIRGLEKQAKQQRPDIYEQELLDLFDAIYNFKDKEFKADIVNRPNDLQYFIDFLEPIGPLNDCSVDSLTPKIYSYQQDKINKLYEADIPNVILINISADAAERAEIIEKCELEGQPFANVNNNIYSKIAFNTTGYAAYTTARELLYQYTDYNSSISIQSIPIYYLDVNRRITVQDKASDIYGDYIIKSISLPLDAKSTMSITATKAMQRI